MTEIQNLNYGDETGEGEKKPETTPVPIVAPAEPVEAPEREPVEACVDTAQVLLSSLAPGETGYLPAGTYSSSRS